MCGSEAWQTSSVDATWIPDPAEIRENQIEPGADEWSPNDPMGQSRLNLSAT
jgi:hypothetical protein